MEDMIRDEFAVPDIENAIEALQKTKSGMISIILMMTRSLNEDEQADWKEIGSESISDRH